MTSVSRGRSSTVIDLGPYGNQGGYKTYLARKVGRVIVESQARRSVTLRSGHGSLTPDQADALADVLREAAANARGRRVA